MYMETNHPTISAKSIQTLLNALQEAQFTMWTIALCLNSAAEDITKAVKNSGLDINFINVEHTS